MPVPPSGSGGRGDTTRDPGANAPCNNVATLFWANTFPNPPTPSPFSASSWVAELAMPMLDQHVLLDDVIFWSLPSYTHPLKTAASLL